MVQSQSSNLWCFCCTFSRSMDPFLFRQFIESMTSGHPTCVKTLAESDPNGMAKFCLFGQIWLGFGQILGISGQLVGWGKSVGSEQVLGARLPGEGCEGEDRQNSWINIAPPSLHPNSLSCSPIIIVGWRGGECQAETSSVGASTFSASCASVCEGETLKLCRVTCLRWSPFDPPQMTGLT